MKNFSKYDNKIFDTYIWYSNAKVNLFLLIGPVLKKSKLHKIYSLFLPVNLYDIFYVQEANEFNLEYFDKEGNKLNINNCIIEKINKMLEIKPKLKIKIIKHIPIGGGLGGASSNSYTYLKILNYFGYIEKKKILNNNFLLKIGSDIPFFKYNEPCIVQGSGEKIKKIKKFPDNIYFIISNEDIVSDTAFMYKEIDIRREKDKMNLENIKNDFIKNIKNQKKILKKILKYDYRYLRDLKNDFEEIFFLKFKKTLKYYPLKGCYIKSILSGSGSSFLYIFDDLNELLNTLNENHGKGNVLKVKFITKY